MPTVRTRLAAAAAFLALAAPLSTVTVPAEAGLQEHRQISIQGEQTGPRRFFVKGRVQPDYPDGAAVVQRRVGRHGHWTAYEEFRTSDRSRYRQRVRALRHVGRVYYRVKVDASGDFATSFSRPVFLRTCRGSCD